MQEHQITTQLYGHRSQRRSWSIRDIFEDNRNWELYEYQHWKELRPVEVKEVQKMMTCKDLERGFFTMYCKTCKEAHDVFFGCSSRICSNCGKNYTDKWAKSLRRAMFKVPHRHLVLSIASELWEVIREYRDLQKIMMDCAIRTLNNVLSIKGRRKLLAGAIVVIHPFSRDISFKPHIHILVTEGGFDSKNKFVPIRFIPARPMRKVWQYEVLTSFKKHLPKTRFYRKLIHQLFEEHPEGFYVYLPKETRITNLRQIGKYVGRYVRHPAIANTRIVNYDGQTVTFWYKDNHEVRHYVSMKVQHFIKSIIQHIPESQFKMIRYYGAYARKHKKRYAHYLEQGSITQSKLGDFPKQRSFKCPNCGSPMEFIEYNKEGPPTKQQFGNSLVDWNYIFPS